MISIIVPVYCGAKAINELHRRIDITIQKHPDFGGYELIFVDDFSPDNSFQVIQDLCLISKSVVGVGLSENFGQQNATYAGLHFASGDIIITMDDDLQHEPELIPSLVKRLDDKTDLVYGVFVSRQDGEYRKLGSKVTGQFFKRNFKVLQGNRVSSYRVIRKSLRDKIINTECGFVYLSCVLLEKCRGVGNVCIPFTPRAEGRSNYNFKKLLKLFVRLNLNYGLLSHIYRKFFKTQKPAYEVNKVVGQTCQGVKTNESDDVRWGNQSAVCN